MGSATINSARSAVVFSQVGDNDVLVPGIEGRSIVVHAIMFAPVYQAGELTSYGLWDSDGNIIIPQNNTAFPDANGVTPPLIYPYNQSGWGVCAPGASLKSLSSNGMDGIVVFTIR